MASSSTTDSVHYEVLTTPIGDLVVAATATGIVRIGLDAHELDRELSALTRLLGVDVVANEGRCDPALAQLREYFEGQRRSFELPVDLALVEGFGRRVVEALGMIPYGDRWSYGTVAEAVGHPRAARAVGTACGNNPLPLIYPCHRVIRSDGSNGLYGGGEDMKAALLDLEAAMLARS